MTILPNHTGQSARPGGNSDHPVVVEEGPSCSKWNAGAPYRLEPMSYTFINIIIYSTCKMDEEHEMFGVCAFIVFFSFFVIGVGAWPAQPSSWNILIILHMYLQ